jgi:hypothetical protein
MFWVWFVQPFAQALGTLALLASTVLAAGIVFGLYLLYAAGAEALKAWKNRRAR